MKLDDIQNIQLNRAVHIYAPVIIDGYDNVSCFSGGSNAPGDKELLWWKWLAETPRAGHWHSEVPYMNVAEAFIQENADRILSN